MRRTRNGGERKYLRDVRWAGESGSDELRAIFDGRCKRKDAGLFWQRAVHRHPLKTFGGAGVLEIPGLQKLVHYICEQGFEHHVAANFSSVAPMVHEATTRYLGWEMYAHAA